MADNTTTQSATPATLPANTTVATVEATFSGDTTHAGVGVLAKSSGSEGSRTLTLINPATEDKQDAEAVLIGTVTETAPATDTASSGLNGRLQRIAQRLTSLIALLPTALGSGGGLKVDGSGTALPVSQSGSWTLGPSASSAETITRVAASASSQQLLAASSRKGGVFFNDSTVACYLKFGTTATSTDFTYKVFPSQTIELAWPIYQGRIDGIWESATGSMQITEKT